MNAEEKILAHIPLSTEEVKLHLLERGFDINRHHYDYDEESGTVYVRMYTPIGVLSGIQEYRPHIHLKGRKDRRIKETKRYFLEVPGENYKRSVFWGMQNIAPDKDYFFIVEGIFDAMAIDMIGEPAIAIIGINMPGDKIQEIHNIGKKPIAILDNDSAGQSAKIKGRNSGKIVHGDMKAVVGELLGGKVYLAPAEYEDFGGMFQKNPTSARIFINNILSDL